MAATLLSSALFVALLLSLSPSGAGADVVTWRKCKKARDIRGRVFEASPDSVATWMNLNDCHLTEVRSGDFDGLPNLERIWLYHNDIADVDPAAFIVVPKLKGLYLEHNDLRQVPVFDEHSFCPSLTELRLHNNRITEIKHPRTFSGCVELQIVSIENNVIEYIHPDVFRPVSKLYYLSLKNNRITVIPETLFIENKKLQTLNLTYNKITYLPSDFVSKVRSAGAPLKLFSFHDNPWHCACLLELLADVKRAGVKYYDQYLYNSTRSCVYSGAFPCCRPTGLLGRAGKQSLPLANAAP